MREPTPYQCGVSVNGHSDVGRLLKARPPHAIALGRDHWADLVAAGWPDALAPDATVEPPPSPIETPDAYRRPLLIIQGTSDYLYGGHTGAFVEALQAASAPLSYAEQPEPHTPSRRGYVDQLDVAQQFFGNCLGGRASPRSDEDGALRVVIEGPGLAPR